MNRLFVALKFPEPIVDKIIEIRKSIYDNNEFGKWEQREKLHLTLKFLGDVDDVKTLLIKDKLEILLSKYSEINCELSNFGFFLPKILWLKLNVDSKLFRMVDEIEDSFVELGFDKEKRSFKPHITLLRIKEKISDELISKFRNYKMPEIKFNCNEATLVKSQLLSGGSVYSDIEVYKLS